jgi:hypothetical protein
LVHSSLLEVPSLFPRLCFQKCKANAKLKMQRYFFPLLVQMGEILKHIIVIYFVYDFIFWIFPILIKKLKKSFLWFPSNRKKTFYLTCSIKYRKSNFALTFHEKMDRYFCALTKIIIDTISFHESKHTHTFYVVSKVRNCSIPRGKCTIFQQQCSLKSSSKQINK